MNHGGNNMACKKTLVNDIRYELIRKSYIKNNSYIIHLIPCFLFSDVC